MLCSLRKRGQSIKVFRVLTLDMSMTIPESNEASQTYSGCYMRRVFASQILITSHHAKPIRPGPILLQANRFPSGELWAAKTSPSWMVYIALTWGAGQKVFSQSHSFAELWFTDREGFCLRVKIHDLRPPGYWEKYPSVLKWAWAAGKGCETDRLVVIPIW